MESAPEKSSRSFRPDTLLASVVVLLLVNVVQRSVGFGRGILYCQWLDPEVLGHWDMAYGFLLLAAPVAVLGLPGSFGRYLERYRQRGQLATFLRRACVWTLTLALGAAALLVWQRQWFAYLVFGDSGESPLLVIVTVVLLMVILHHFLEAVFAGLRVFRVVSCMQFAQSMLFAALSLSLLAIWRADAVSIVAGYGGACAISAMGVLVWAWRSRWDGAEGTPSSVSHREFWPPLLRFAVWVWVTNLLSNLFAVIDRYMIVHFSGLESGDALALVGHYHTSMLVPVLIVSVANLLVGAMTPHLSHDWERGDRQGVAARLNLTFKLTALGMVVAGVGVLLATPVLFHLAFGTKYDEGLAVLPWALASCVWFGLLLVAQTYVWCAEKTRHATLPLAIGLVANVVLNLTFLPIWGLAGAVMATALATLVSLVAQLWVNGLLGMKVSAGAWLVGFAPLLLAFGTSTALAGGAWLLVVAAFTPWLLDRTEQGEIAVLLHKTWRRLVPLKTDLTEGHPTA